MLVLAYKLIQLMVVIPIKLAVYILKVMLLLPIILIKSIMKGWTK